jgi:Primase X
MAKLQNASTTGWIDKLLQTGVEDNRKNLLFWVLAPYLITVRGLDHAKAYDILDAWLDRCNDVSSLEPEKSAFQNRIKQCLDVAKNQGRRPIKFETFKEYYPDVYHNNKSSKLGGGA